MHTKWKVSCLAGFIVGVTFTLTACGTGSTASNATGSPNASSNSSKALKPLTISAGPNGAFQRNFNPFSTSADPGTQGLIYEPLFYDSVVSSNVYGILGRSTAWSNHNKTLTVTLQTNANWTDGKPFTSQDVVFTFNLLKKYPTIDLNAVWSKLSSVKSDGNDKVVFNFKQADVPYATYVLETYIVPQHIWSKLGDPSKVDVTNPVGTGPYTLSTFSPEDYTMKANPNYYGGKLSVPEVDFPAYNSNDSADLALSTGSLDWTGLFIPNIDKVYSSKNQNNKYWFAPGGLNLLTPNLKNPLLGNQVVRQAISMAVNRNDLSQKAEYGYEKVANPTGLILPTFQSWVDPNLPKTDTTFTFDPTGAEKLLQSAGFKKNGSGIYVSANGQALSFKLIVPSGWTDWDQDAALIAAQLKQIGIQINVQQEQYAGYQSDLSSHKFDLALVSTNVGPSPYYVYQNTFGTGASTNYEQWSDPKTDQALADFASTTNETEQKQDIDKLEKIVSEQLPAIPLIYGAEWYEYNDSQYTGWPDANNPYVTPAPFSYPAEEIVLLHLKPTAK
ncbi:ABC transporter substrate-binding protein [Alicyclobacillus fastidiosus]|uniref:ABC transporter substrate-binding protein n=1 Tax=Alicyclobacillus fastidiosus TaxID=392011 RepID=A0ABV5AJG4_9BACL|nr:ABC transporter substrate-binding protein [Alicyclobacillus fastidiosus]WEH08338.1 ABC transporter substrate-binding protein [Alicyclobacillus fastidiosus]